MKIQILMENTALDGFLCEHGLSVYVETEGLRLLADTGKSGDFVKNAARLGVDLKKTDIVTLSHGHYDHGGGLSAFLEINGTAAIYAQRSAFGPYYSDHGESIDYIGLDGKLLESGQLHLLDGDRQISDQIFLFSGVSHESLWPKSNRTLYEKVGTTFRQDQFRHEQNLVITEGGRQVLISGCAHNGIVNILKKSHSLTGRWPDEVIGGFHLMNPGKKEEADLPLVMGTADFLKGLSTVNGPTRYYTGHCTGEPALQILKESLGSRVEALHSGQTILL